MSSSASARKQLVALAEQGFEGPWRHARGDFSDDARPASVLVLFGVLDDLVCRPRRPRPGGARRPRRAAAGAGRDAAQPRRAGRLPRRPRRRRGGRRHRGPARGRRGDRAGPGRRRGARRVRRAAHAGQQPRGHPGARLVGPSHARTRGRRRRVRARLPRPRRRPPGPRQPVHRRGPPRQPGLARPGLPRARRRPDPPRVGVHRRDARRHVRPARLDRGLGPHQGAGSRPPSPTTRGATR